MALSLSGVGGNGDVTLASVFSDPIPKAYMPVIQYPLCQSDAMKLPCENCGKETIVGPHRLKVCKHFFCSRQCFNDWRRKRPENYTDCIQCGCKFHRIKSHIRQNGQNFCSRKCHYEFHHPVFLCRYCGEEFRRKLSEVKFRGGAPFCSNKCYHSSDKRNPDCWEMKICKTCGVEFEIPKAWVRKGEGKFCSKNCHDDWQRKYAPRGENAPYWKGGWEPYYGPNWPEQRRKALERDGYVCRKCGKFQGYKNPCVHHIKPFREFGRESYEGANDLENLITLCVSCHIKTENEVT